ncbi:MAG: anthranilate/aminodeoxychorismate synthase component II [Waddliaceae bacterium]|nr:anthranilate/aminodeoxychorismate synthase component II [Waddliaceae bacterium]|tara:strand:+ start:85 stop:648 length:564 start_codon:yes stop_codon:yes gene_type:complete
MLLFIDNFDSFTYNLVQELLSLGTELKVVRNNEWSVKKCIEFSPSHLLIGPGPGSPKDTGIASDLIEHFAGKIPILGVCLGHQLIAEYFGANVGRASKVMHGKTSMVQHFGEGLFSDLPNPVEMTRYHSLIVDLETLPACLQAMAWTEEGELMAIQHMEHAIFGVQFHPESVLSTHGSHLFRNFLEQ